MKNLFTVTVIKVRPGASDDRQIFGFSRKQPDIAVVRISDDEWHEIPDAFTSGG